MRDEKETKLKAAITRTLRIVILLSAVSALPMAAHGAFATDSQVPKHGPMILLGGGLMGIGFWGRRRKRMQE
jgi:hypothetical protein